MYFSYHTLQVANSRAGTNWYALQLPETLAMAEFGGMVCEYFRLEIFEQYW